MVDRRPATVWRRLPSQGSGQDYFQPALEPTLEVRPGDRLFAVGSCFARSLELNLAAVLDFASYVPPAELPQQLDLRVHLGTLWHRYNPFAIRNTLLWALRPETCPPGRLVAVAGGLAVDPFAGPRQPMPLPEARALVRFVDSVFARLRGCRIVLLTLGLQDLWLDAETGLTLNATPVRALNESYPRRFRLRRTSVAEILQVLEEIRSLVREEAGEAVQIVVTVSPVPMAASFGRTSPDVAIVNSGCKAMLRAAAEEWTAVYDGLHYFPSYEMVTLSAPARAWGADARHPTVEMVRHVTGRFLNEFVVGVRKAVADT